MRAWVEEGVLVVHREDVPAYQRNGSVVRNSFFWALRSIAGFAARDRDWEFEEDLWVALQRMLLSFAESGYLSLSETQLEFSPQATLPEPLRLVSTWRSED